MKKLILIFSAFLYSQYGFTAPAISSPVCLIVGLVEEIKTRNVPNKPEIWRKQRQLSKAKSYIDVSLKLFSSKGIESGTGNCNLKSFDNKTFQLRNSEKRFKTGDCIQAKTQFSGDEFYIGQWLFDIKKLASEKCTNR